MEPLVPDFDLPEIWQLCIKLGREPVDESFFLSLKYIKSFKKQKNKWVLNGEVHLLCRLAHPWECQHC